MKIALLLITFFSFSTIASNNKDNYRDEYYKKINLENCTYFVARLNNLNTDDIFVEADLDIEEKMFKKGYQRVYRRSEAFYYLVYTADTWGDGRTRERQLSNHSRAELWLYDNMTMKIVFEGAREGSIGLRRRKVANQKRLKQVLEIIPNCSDYQ